MPLTPEEAAELKALEAKYAPAPNKLSPQEQAELQALESKYGAQKTPIDSSKITAEGPTEHESLLMKTVGMPYDQAKRISGMVQGANPVGKVLSGGVGSPMAIVGKEAGKSLVNFFSKSAPISGAIRKTGSGIKGLGDWFMQKAVGRTKYTPGIGTELADQGIMGTKEAMRRQVQAKLPEAGKRIEEVASTISSPIDYRKIASDIAGSPLGQRGLVPGASPSAADIGTIQKISAYLDDIASRGQESASQAIRRRSSAGQREFGARETPGASLEAQLAKAEQQGISRAFKEAGGEEAIKADKLYEALKKAEKPLVQETKIPQGPISILNKLGNMVPSSLAESLVGQAATKVGKPLSNLPKGLSEAELMAILAASTPKVE